MSWRGLLRLPTRSLWTLLLLPLILGFLVVLMPCGILVLSLSHALLVWLVALPAQRPLVLWCCLHDRFYVRWCSVSLWIGVVLVGGA